MSPTDSRTQNAADARGSTPEPGASRPPQPSDARASGLGRRLALWLFGLLTGGLLRLLGATWRVETIGHDPQRPGRGGPARIAALFHESMVPCAWLYRDRGYSVAVSRSRDGDLIRATLLALGYGEPARGSSSRGGSAALRQMMRKVEAGTTVAVLVDGPRGPARVAKTGILSLARHANRPIQPVAFSARPAIRLRSWDQSLVPLPFARVVVAYGEPIAVAGDEPTDELHEQTRARRLEECMNDLHHEADGVLLTRED